MAGFPNPGDRVGRYQVVREIGRGPLGRVYEATDTSNESSVALKVLVPWYKLEEDTRELLANDLEALAALASPQVVPVTDYDEHENRIFIVSPYFPQGSLQNRLDKHGELTRPAALALGTHLAKALHDAHAVGVVHGGVKPTNVFRSSGAGAQSLPQLADFGATLRAGDWLDSGGSGSGAGYRPPERDRGEPLDVRSDVYGLGCLLHAALTGRPPTRLGADFDRIHEVDDVDGRINDLLERALQTDPADRYQSVTELGRELTALASAAAEKGQLSPRAASTLVRQRPAAAVATEEAPAGGDLPDVVAGPALAAVQGTAQYDEPEPPSRRRVPVLVAGVAAVALVAAGGSWLWGHQRADHDKSGGSGATGTTTDTGSGAPAAPTVKATAAYRAVSFALTPATDGTLEIDLGKGWQATQESSVRVPTAAGGQKACLKARTTAADGTRSETVEVCGSSAPPTLRAVRVRPDCVVQGFPQVCYRLEARGFRSGTDPVLSFIVDNRAAGNASVHIGADGTGTLPGGQKFHFADSDAGKTAIITLAGKTYRWKVAHR